jgi:hypothetical protein
MERVFLRLRRQDQQKQSGCCSISGRQEQRGKERVQLFSVCVNWTDKRRGGEEYGDIPSGVNQQDGECVI